MTEFVWIENPPLDKALTTNANIIEKSHKRKIEKRQFKFVKRNIRLSIKKNGILHRDRMKVSTYEPTTLKITAVFIKTGILRKAERESSAIQ